MTYLLDTPVVSEPARPNPSESVLNWLTVHAADSALSVITVGELQKGISQMPAGTRRTRFDAWISNAVLRGFQILPVDTRVALVWGRLLGEAAAEGSPLPNLDSLIAATALVHDLTVVTRNVRHFERCGVVVKNPWGD
jgi:hypothetical protein